MSSTKQEMINELDCRVADKILEPTNADFLKKWIAKADNDNEAIMIASLGTTYKRTGLHFDKRLEKMSNTIKYFKKNETLSFHTDDDKPTHKLIIGDNYEALQNLLIQYRGKVNVIYIDPPYGKDSMGEFAATNYNNAITRDNLLSMLYPRLQLAKQLLSDDGVIFCSIDDRNQAYVKCLFDEVMGEGNFVANIIRISTKRVKGDAKAINQIHDYVLLYGKSEYSEIVHRLKEDFAIYELEDEYVKERGRHLIRPLDNGSINYSIAADYIIKAPDGTDIYAGGDKNARDVRISGKASKKDWCFRWSESKLKWGIEHGFIVFKKTNEKWRCYFKIYQFVDNNLNPTEKYDNHLSVIDGHYNNQGTTEVKSVFGKTVFDYPKPIGLIKELVSMCPREDCIVLDFFAGSGTTGEAILDYNKDKKTNKQFILCTLNEKTDVNPNGIAYDVTSKRLKRIMTGECYDGTKDFKWIEKNEPYGGNLDVYEIESVANFESTTKKTPFDVIDETLYGKEKFKKLQEKIEWVCENFNNAQKVVE